ncbi:MAG: hypothetical protein NZ805_11040 [Armatimonadetes bacterium]|nr:hypothetical protein [Armatimonadota bacterium]MDW8029319.1 hypothetical protein [Armatimonadota bacterium]
MPTISAQVAYPIILHDMLQLPSGHLVDVILEVHEEGVIARLALVPDVCSDGATVAEAKANLVKTVQDELSFLQKHRKELSENLLKRLETLEQVLTR